MEMNKSIVGLLKRFILNPPNDGQDNRKEVSTVQAHLMQYGYMLDEDAFMALSKSDFSFISNFHDEAIAFLKEATGGKRNFQPLYKNFPQEVMALSDFELFFNAICHYWSNGTWEPQTPVLEKPVKFEKIKYTMLRVADEATFNKIFTDLVSINQSITPQDMRIVKWFVSTKQKLVMPNAIPFKENLCTLAAMGVPGLPVKTPTDVLRIAVHLSGGDISLPSVPPKEVRANRWSSRKEYNPEREKFKFRKFKRSERKYILTLLESTGCNVSEMVLKAQRWIRLGEILHPGEYKQLFPKAFEAFQKLRNEKVVSWYGKLQAAFDKSFEAGINVLAERPGEFMRRLDWLLRSNGGDRRRLVFAKLNEIAVNSSNKVLFEAYSHFEKRIDPVTGRSIMIKGARRRTQLPDLPAIKAEVVEAVHSTVFTALKTKFSELAPLGNVWIDDELKKIPLPTNMRSVGDSLKPRIRGQRIPLDNQEAKVVRPFVHWMDKRGSEDLDLSVTFVGAKGGADVLSFSRQRIGNSVHSGDVRYRQGPCAEYIDIDINDARKRGYKYAVIDVRNFNGGSLESVETCFGIMERQHPECNSTWLPETISNTLALESKSSVTIISIIDIDTMEYVFLDIDSEGVTFASGDVKNILKTIEDYTTPPKFSFYDLLAMHAEARGKIVTLDTDKTIDTMFKVEDFMDSYEAIGEYMGI